VVITAKFSDHSTLNVEVFENSKSVGSNYFHYGDLARASYMCQIYIVVSWQNPTNKTGRSLKVYIKDTAQYATSVDLPKNFPDLEGLNIDLCNDCMYGYFKNINLWRYGLVSLSVSACVYLCSGNSFDLFFSLPFVFCYRFP
jgi:hypothetical protein